ncbi:DUF4178 domain-containing protein [Nannocystis punicea]|uniref:DUF4178 domain-containing protein n=1 Tax=Nannocystis punicea TaxID=2995304 RepID=A0ABY7H638_9BACT|nr:DUF4178 domain-containing protein [Nannocystis poenicansa]WAS94739.1 DUF4178 domain-containing protein [Nannocystis poenicansa]
MLTLASLLAAMTIAGAFWVGILAARRLRDWGDRRQLTEGDGPHPPLALAAAASVSTTSGSIPGDPVSQKIRARVAQRLQGRLQPAPAPRAAPDTPDGPELTLTSLRQGDVIVVETGDPNLDGDYLVDGVVNLKEGATATVIAVMTDADRHRWLIGSPDQERWLLAEPVRGHGLSGEPPRHIPHQEHTYALERRGQASAAGVGMHGRPALPRVATYVYRAAADRALWVERWGDQVLVGAATAIPQHAVQFLPGS